MALYYFVMVVVDFSLGTMERVEKEGLVATANTYAMLFSSLPSCGKPTKLVIYDIHTLQNRFFFHNSCVPSLQSCIPLFRERLRSSPITTIAFPDDGAAKRFGDMFTGSGFRVIVCGKTRVGDKRIVRVQDGDCKGELHGVVIPAMCVLSVLIFYSMNVCVRY